jgi:hypothetical protein
MKRMRLDVVVRAIVLGLATWAVLAGNVASAAVIVVPNSLAAVEGNVSNGFPFNIGDSGLPSQRYQQVFAASEFLSLAGPHFITQIAFRPNATFGGGGSQPPSPISNSTCRPPAPPPTS